MKQSRGFTLVELVIAMTLMALIAVGLSGVLVIGARSASSAERKTEQARRYRVATELIVRQIRSTAALRLPEDESDELSEGEDIAYFLGESDRLSFITAAPQAPENSGLAVVDLWVEEGQLMMSESPYFLLASEGKIGAEFEDLTFAATLLYDVESVSFEYQRSDLERENWANSWDASEEEASVDGGPYWYHEVPLFVATLNEVTGEDQFSEPED
jgi:prepilin-type N-terminal cleavage/methylation domain-containing protein